MNSKPGDPPEKQVRSTSCDSSGKMILKSEHKKKERKLDLIFKICKVIQLMVDPWATYSATGKDCR